jgi:hypothetical protein
MQDVEDEPLFCERVAGLDIAKAGVEVTSRVPSDTTAGRRQQETRGFGHPRRPGVAGRLAGLLGRDQGRDGGQRRAARRVFGGRRADPGATLGPRSRSGPSPRVGIPELLARASLARQWVLPRFWRG